MKGTFRLTTPSRTIRDLAAILSLEKLEVVVDDAVSRNVTTLDALGAKTAGARRGVTGVGGLRAIVEDRLAHGTPESYLETTALSAIRKAGLPRPLSQYEIRTSDGAFVARPDLVYLDLKLAIELDGDAYHGTKAQRNADRTRQNRIVLAGWSFLRFNDADVRNGDLVRSLFEYSSQA